MKIKELVLNILAKLGLKKQACCTKTSCKKAEEVSVVETKVKASSTKSPAKKPATARKKP
jgi:hypothetical protein